MILVDIIVKIKIKDSWVKNQSPIVRKHIRGYIVPMIEAALLGNGKVLEIKFDKEKEEESKK